MLPCEIYGRPAEPTPLGSWICPDCRSRYRQFRCIQCGERVARLGDPFTDWPEFAAGICSDCRIRERVAALSAEDREVIRFAVSRGTVSAVKEMRGWLGWSIPEAVTAVELMRHQSHAAVTPAICGTPRSTS
jgi:hypothetical protein